MGSVNMKDARKFIADKKKVDDAKLQKEVDKKEALEKAKNGKAK